MILKQNKKARKQRAFYLQDLISIKYPRPDSNRYSLRTTDFKTNSKYWYFNIFIRKRFIGNYWVTISVFTIHFSLVFSVILSRRKSARKNQPCLFWTCRKILSGNDKKQWNGITLQRRKGKRRGRILLNLWKLLHRRQDK